MPDAAIECTAVAFAVFACSPGERVCVCVGQASVDGTGKIVTDTFEGEMRRAMGNVVAILAAAGMTSRMWCRCGGYVGRAEDLRNTTGFTGSISAEPFPARSTLIRVLGMVLKFEIDVMAYPGGPVAIV